MSKYVISYVYPGMSGRGQEEMKPVGKVYVRQFMVGGSPVKGTFSYTKKAAEASTWDTIDEAARESFRWDSNEARVIPLSEATDL